jgi:heme exporter protein D
MVRMSSSHRYLRKFHYCSLNVTREIFELYDASMAMFQIVLEILSLGQYSTYVTLAYAESTVHATYVHVTYVTLAYVESTVHVTYVTLAYAESTVHVL